MNKSKTPVEVRYKLTSLPKKEDSTHRSEEVFWFPFRSKRTGIEIFAHSFDETTNTYTFTLPAKKRAIIGDAIGSSRFTWNLENLRIKTPTQEIYQEGEALKHFFGKMEIVLTPKW